MRRIVLGTCVGGVMIALMGCGGDVVKTMSADPGLQSRIMNAITADPVMAGEMANQLLNNEPARKIVIEKLTANGDAMQAVMLEIAKDESRIDGVINLAVQDSAMRTHVMTLFKGMQIGGAR